MMAGSHLGLSPPPWGGPTIVKARAVGATLEAPSIRPTVLICTYLVDGVGPYAANRKIMFAIGCRLQSLGHAADGDQAKHIGPMPHAAGGDFNLTLAHLMETGFADDVNGTIVAPKTARGTCRSATSGRALDVPGVKRPRARDRSRCGGRLLVIKTHVPVMLSFRPRLTMLRALALRTPPKLPVDRVYGPVRPRPSWGACQGGCQESGGGRQERRTRGCPAYA